MATDIVLKDRNGQPVIYKGIETVTFDTPTEGVQTTFTHGTVMEGVTIEPNFAKGDQVISVPDGSLVKEATIVKPAELVPENIRYGTNVAGVEGELIGDTEEVTVDLDMAEGGQVITPSAVGKVLSKVTVTKPGTMKPENIKAGVGIGGVVGEYVTPGTTKEIEPDFSAGDYTVNGEGDERWNEVVVKKPENLKPENIAKDVEIGGVVGTKEGGSPLCTFSYFVSGSTKSTSAQTQMIEVPLSVSVPLSSDVIMVLTGSGTLKGSSSSMPSNYPLISSMLVNTEYTETEDTEAKTVSYASRTFVGALVVYAACMAVFFAIPGITLKTEGDELIFCCDRSVATLPNGVYGSARMQDRNIITEVDLLESSIVGIPDYAFMSMVKLKKVTFPDTLTTIGKSAFSSCNALETVDCTACKSVPTLATYVFEKNTGLQILVPAALYDTWKAATNWTTYASYIVAV